VVWPRAGRAACQFACAAGSGEAFHAELDVNLDWINVAYGEQAIHGSAVVLKGEPVVLKIGLVNGVRGQQASAEADWLRRISLTLRRGGRFDGDDAARVVLMCGGQPGMLSSRSSMHVGDRIALGPGGNLVAGCDVPQTLVNMEAGNLYRHR
jgi:hypothetical protein